MEAGEVLAGNHCDVGGAGGSISGAPGRVAKSLVCRMPLRLDEDKLVSRIVSYMTLSKT